MLLGLLVALVVWYWPTGAVWRVETTEKALGFSLDGGTVLTLSASQDGLTAASLLHRDVASGQLTNSVKLHLDPITIGTEKRLSPDRKTLLVGIAAPSAWPHNYFVDTTSGKPRAGPMTEMGHINPDSFSKDSRWMWVYHKPSQPGNRFHEVDIVSAVTGETVIALRPESERTPWSCRFSDDGDRVAVLWRPSSEANDVTSVNGFTRQVRLMDLASGREVRRFDLPVGKWQTIRNWDDRAMVIECKVDDGDMGCFLRCHEFDLASSSNPPLGREIPLLSGYVDHVIEGRRSYGQTWFERGPGWLIYVTADSISVTNWQAAQSRVDSVLGTAFLQTRGDQKFRVRRVDPVSGWTISQISNIPFGWQPRFSDDGRWLAIEARGGIELWDTFPPLRWPWAIGAGAATAFALVLLRRWFRGASSGRSAGGSSGLGVESPG